MQSTHPRFLPSCLWRAALFALTLSFAALGAACGEKAGLELTLPTSGKRIAGKVVGAIDVVACGERAFMRLAGSQNQGITVTGNHVSPEEKPSGQ